MGVPWPIGGLSEVAWSRKQYSCCSFATNPGNKESDLTELSSSSWQAKSTTGSRS